MAAKKVATVTATLEGFQRAKALFAAIEAASELELFLIAAGEVVASTPLVEGSGLPITATVINRLPGEDGVSRSKSLGLGVMAFADLWASLTPDLLLLTGHEPEMVAAAQAALPARIPIVHLHPSAPPRGPIRWAAMDSLSKMSHLHLIQGEGACQRLTRMGEAPERLFDLGQWGEGWPQGVVRTLIEADVAGLIQKTFHDLNTSADFLNAETLQALRQARKGENLTTWDSVDGLIKSAE
ncbi:MAG: UDP-N-acetylglucosamine 2-epimerase [Magnetococcales bacterium]|nr:UDP-N-acetylglucosamine 2-epimerase [Magnetococcales bacterium]